jgi:hypothetical protein
MSNQGKNKIKIVIFSYILLILIVFVLGYIYHLSNEKVYREPDNLEIKTNIIDNNKNADNLIEMDEIKNEVKNEVKIENDNYYDSDDGLLLVEEVEKNLIKKSLNIVGQGKFLEVNNFLASELKKYNFDSDSLIMSYYWDFSKLPFLEEANLNCETNMIKGINNIEVVILIMPRVSIDIQNNIIIDKDSFSIYLSENQDINISNEISEINENDRLIHNKYFTESDSLEKYLVIVNNIKLKALVAEDYTGKYLLGFYPINKSDINIYPSISQ